MEALCNILKHRIPSSRFTKENSADTNRVFLWEASENPPFVKAIDGWKMVGYGKAPWPKSGSHFAVMFEKQIPKGGYPSIRGEEMEEGDRIWHHMEEKWFRKTNAEATQNSKPPKPMTPEEYKTRFIAHLTAKGVAPDVAENEHAAWSESFASDIADGIGSPEEDAEEAISAWSD
jgi:hypothetical protein